MMPPNIIAMMVMATEFIMFIMPPFSSSSTMVL